MSISQRGGRSNSATSRERLHKIIVRENNNQPADGDHVDMGSNLPQSSKTNGLYRIKISNQTQRQANKFSTRDDDKK